MKRIVPAETAQWIWPNPWQMCLIALCALVLCSCRGPLRYDRSMVEHGGPSGLPQEAYAGVAGASDSHVPPIGPPGMEKGVPLASAPQGPWAPPGFSQPWPKDEYLRDGGDRELAARVADDWQVHGLDVEDTVAHFDTLDGRTMVEPSNRVHIYSPRFGAVRQVVGLRANETARRSAGVYLPTRLVGPKATDIVANSKQNVQANRQIGRKPPSVFLSKQGDGVMSRSVGLRGFQDTFMVHENLAAIRQGVIDSAETAFLAQGVDAARAWSTEQAVQVILDEQAAMEDVSDQDTQSFYTIKEPPAQPKLRVIKVASTDTAKPGDEVAFTIRFDNMGNQPIGNVTIIDNLTTRLEYVADSAQCSLDAQFFTQPNT
ncbi:MAG: DUF11 domain-containing protein, partial [Candidatus Nealsonbacteria bacterium]|nr:DUF11 domain-containing protein [Candidatus Nealsonbacteria bacterium]